MTPLDRHVPAGVTSATIVAMQFSIRAGLNGGARGFMARAVAAEEAGFDQIWTGNDFLGRSGVVGLAAAATATSRIRLGVGVVDPVTLHPGQIASIASDMQSLSSGRFLLGVGAGSDVFYGRAGLEPPSPVRRTREGVAAIKALLRGESPAGDPLAAALWADGAGLEHPPDVPPPVYIGAMGPKMLALAGRLADGALPLCLPPSRFARARQLIEAGAAAHERDLDDFDLAACIWCSIDDDRELARASLARHIAQYSGSLSPDALAEEGLDPAEFQGVQRIVLEDGLDAGARAVTESMLTLGVWGGPDDVLEQIQRLFEQGVQHVSFGPPMGPDVNDALRVLGDKVFPDARRLLSS